MDELQEAAIRVVSSKQNRRTDKELSLYIQETYDIKDKREIAFFLEFIKSGKAYKSYQSVYGEHISKGSAAVSANRLLKKAKFKISDFLDHSGHSIAETMEVLDKLKETEPKEYMKYIVKMRGLDQHKVEHSGSIQMPIINIVGD